MEALRDRWARIVERWRQLIMLARFLWRAGRLLTLTVVGLAVLRALMPAVIILATGSLIGAIPAAVTDGLASPSGGRALLALAIIAAAFLANGIAEATGGYAGQALSARFTLVLHDAVAAATTRPATVAPLEDPEVAAELAAVEGYDDEGLYERAVAHLQHVLHVRIQGIAAFVILLGFAWWAPLILLVAWRAYDHVLGASMLRASMTVHHQRGTGLRRAGYLRGMAVDASAAKEVRVFGLGGWLTEQYHGAWLRAMPEIWQQRRASRRAIAAAAGGLLSAHLIMLGVLAWAAWNEQLSVAALIVLVQAVIATEAQGTMDYQSWELGQTLTGIGAVVGLDKRLRGTDPSRPAMSTPAGPASVRIDRLRFAYRGRVTPVLDDVSLTIPPGQSVAIVGANGAGKSTLIKLLCGLYAPDRGQIMINSRVAVIFQDFVRYELPLRDNVGFGALDLADDPDELARALRDAGGGDLLDTLPAGLDTVLARDYADGTDLSGGQWQKIALARALLAVRAGAGLLVLDEPAAHLDVRAEADLFDRFLDLTKDVTTILVSHRLSSVRRADRIIVLAGGRIVEDGSHEELITAGATYASLYALQAERFASRADDHA